VNVFVPVRTRRVCIARLVGRPEHHGHLTSVDSSYDDNDQCSVYVCMCVHI